MVSLPDAERLIRMDTIERTAGSEPKLIPLKCAAYDLDLTPEGLRQRLIRLGSGIRRGGRWYIDAVLVERMQVAAEVLGGPQAKDACRKKEPCLSCDELADQAGLSVASDGGGIAASSARRNGSKTNKLAAFTPDGPDLERAGDLTGGGNAP